MKPLAYSQARTAASLRDPRWKKLLARDRSSDGMFLYAVETTGVYCRPSCASRVPLPQNVVFYADAESTCRGGFRACKRCKPDASRPSTPHADKVAQACRLLEGGSSVPKPTPSLMLATCLTADSTRNPTRCLA